MPPKKKSSAIRLNRPLAVTRAFCAIGLAVCFFLPWLSVSCSEDVFARARGIDLLEGRLEMIGDAPQAVGVPLASLKSFPDEPALWAWIGATAVLVLIGVLGAAYASKVVSGISSLAAAVLLALYLWFFAFGFAAEREVDAERKRRGDAAGAPALLELRVQREPAYHVSAGLALLILVLGVVEGSGAARKRG